MGHVLGRRKSRSAHISLIAEVRSSGGRPVHFPASCHIRTLGSAGFSLLGVSRLREVDSQAAPGIVSISVSSNMPMPQIESVTRRLAFVSAFISAFANCSPLRFPMATAPMDSSVRPVGVVACAVTANTSDTFSRLLIEILTLCSLRS